MTVDTTQPIFSPHANQDPPPRELSAQEEEFLQLDARFIRHKVERLGALLGLGTLHRVALRDSAVVLGFSTDMSRKMLEQSSASLQSVVSRIR